MCGGFLGEKMSETRGGEGRKNEERMMMKEHQDDRVIEWSGNGGQRRKK